MKAAGRIIATLLAVVLLFAAGGCTAQTPTPTATPPQTRTVTDVDGTEIVVPYESMRIASSAPAMTSAVVFAGAANKLVALCDASLNSRWLSDQFPYLTDLPVTFAANVANVESTMTTNPDLVLLLSRYGEDAKTQFDAIDGVTVIMPASNPDFSQMEAVIQRQYFIGQVIGGEAATLAEQFRTYFEGKLQEITDVTNTIPEADRPRVMDLRQLSATAVISGNGGVQDEWIKIGGGIPVGPDAANGVNTNMEQILLWDPEVIICDIPTDIAELKADPAWANVTAVKNDQLYVMPSGAMMWGYGTPEEALMVQWIAKTLNPDLFPDLDIRAEAKSFYKTFLKLDLTDEGVEGLFHGITIGD